ncbi:transposase [Helcococcus ovis]|nr:transposase [Helcococcus ovis]
MKFRESLIDNKETDSYESKDGDLFVRIKDKKRVKKSGYISTSKVYKCFDWNKDGFKTKSLYFTEIFEKYRLNYLENITSLEGINERINRSIQAEGEFSKLKEALGYKRFNHKGLKNVVTEISIMAIAMNLNTLTNKIYDKDYGPTRYQISEEKIA